MKTIDMVGQRIGRLVVIERAGSNKGGEALWRCRCDCGGEKVVRGVKLRSGETRSCGCLENETRVENGRKRMPVVHGKSKSRLYEVWAGMKRRCYNRSHKHYLDYGGRGIKVCDEWRDDFGAFEKWAIENSYDEHAEKGACTLDRINVDGDYSPSNCRFADMTVQQNNRRDRASKVDVVLGDDGIYHASPNCGRKVTA